MRADGRRGPRAGRLPAARRRADRRERRRPGTRLVDDPPPGGSPDRPARAGSLRPTSRRPFVADASAPDHGRVLAAHALGPTAIAAAAAAVDRLRRQLRRARDSEVALRDEPRVIARGIAELRRMEPQRPELPRKPPEERRIVHRRASSDEPRADALGDRRPARRRPGVPAVRPRAHPRGRRRVLARRRPRRAVPPAGQRPVADEGPPVVPEPSRYSEPLSLAVRAPEMDLVDHRFLYFIDPTRTRQGAVPALRRRLRARRAGLIKACATRRRSTSSSAPPCSRWA